MPAAATLPALLAGGFIRVRIMGEGSTLPRPSMSERVMSGTGTGIQAGQVASLGNRMMPHDSKG
jgi:hypothetical protein